MAGTVAPNIVTDGLVLYLDAANTKSYVSGSTTWVDIAAGKNGILTNGPTFSTDGGGSILLDGVNETIYLGTGNTVFPLPQISYEFFFKSLGTVPTTGTSPALIGLTYGVRLFVESTRLNAAFDDGVSVFNYLATSGTNDYRDGRWYHVAVTHDGINFKIYVNGQLSSSRTSSWTGVTRWPTNTFNLGRDNNNVNYFFKGNIGVFKLYNKVLSSQEILQNYNATKTRFGLT